MSVTLYFVVPCYKDENVLPVTGPVFLRRLRELTEAFALSENSRVLFVNDGSPDGTWNAIRALNRADPRAVGISLAFNAGEKNAILAGMDQAVENGADCVITADSDLQDDIGVADDMLRAFLNGNDLVLGVRSERSEDPPQERFFSKSFYTAMRLMKTGLVPEHSNFRLMSARAVRLLREHERNAYYLPAMASALPLARSTVSYKRTARAAGSSGYNFRKKFRLAADAVLYHSAVLPVLLPVCASALGAGAVGAALYAARVRERGEGAPAAVTAAAVCTAGAACACALSVARERVSARQTDGAPYRVAETVGETENRG